MSEQTWDKLHPFGNPTDEDWIMCQSVLASRDTRLITVGQLRSLGSRSVIPTRVVDGDYLLGDPNFEEMFGGVIFVTSPAVISFLPLPAGASFTVVTLGNIEVTVVPDSEVVIYLDGVALDAGDTIVNSSTAGDAVTFVSIGPGEVYASSALSWSDNGQPS